MAVLLKADSNTPVQRHLNELSARVTLVFVVTFVLTVVWSRYVDGVLAGLLDVLQPCAGDCLNVYDPAQWSAVRWTAALLLGLFSCMPLLVHQCLVFSKPGLLSSEYIALKRWMFGGVVAVFIATYGLVLHGLPQLYQVGYEQHSEAGLAAQYSAIDMLLVAMYLVWVVLIMALSWLMLALAGSFHLLNKNTADWWRWRVYGMGVLLLLLTVPEHAASTTLPLVALYVISCEGIATPWSSRAPPYLGIVKERFDSEGRRRTYTVLDCACAGANIHAHLEPASGCATLHLDALCLNPDEHERVLEHIMRTRTTDVFITGCDTRACPASFMTNMAALNAEVHGLNLMSLQNHRVEHNHLVLDAELAMLSMHHATDEPGYNSRIEEWCHRHAVPMDHVHQPDVDGWTGYRGSEEFIVPVSG